MIEFVRNGRRPAKIFRTLQELVEHTSRYHFEVIFIARNKVDGKFYDEEKQIWMVRHYPAGFLFEGQSIHRSEIGEREYLECIDEDGFLTYLRTTEIGRFSLIATTIHQHLGHEDLYLYSTQAENVSQLIKRLQPKHSSSSDCVRLVRGTVPINFSCQYLSFLHERTKDVLVGVTEEDIVVEWNIKSDVPCRYSLNLENILKNISETYLEETFGNYFDRIRKHYRENIPSNIQLVSDKDLTNIPSFWQSIQTTESNQIDDQVHTPSGRRLQHRSDLFISIQVTFTSRDK